jgi:thymine-DNA glycosylase
MTAVKGHHYANPTNHFWRCLHLSGTFSAVASVLCPLHWLMFGEQGFTPRLLSASEDSSLPGTYNIGLVRQNPDSVYVPPLCLSPGLDSHRSNFF